MILSQWTYSVALSPDPAWCNMCCWAEAASLLSCRVWSAFTCPSTSHGSITAVHYNRVADQASCISVSHSIYAGEIVLLTFASRFALARRFLSHTMTCTARAVACVAKNGKQNEQLLSLSRHVKVHNKAKLADTCCSVALPACCTAVVNSGVGLECPALKCCSSKLICAWLGFHLGLCAHYRGSQPGRACHQRQ